jgi:hypothetical protein
MGNRDRDSRDGGGGGGGRKKARYQKHGPGPAGGGHAIPQGVRGLLVTCDAGRERRCGDELSALCEAAFERLGSSDDPSAAAAAAAPAAGGDTVDARLAAEVAALRDKRKDRFRYYETGVRGTFFLAFPSPFREPGAPGPVAVATDLVERARATGRSGSRFAQRLVPVERTCFAGLVELAAMALEVAKEHFGAVVALAGGGAGEEGGGKTAEEGGKEGGDAEGKGEGEGEGEAAGAPAAAAKDEAAAKTEPPPAAAPGNKKPQEEEAEAAGGGGGGGGGAQKEEEKEPAEAKEEEKKKKKEEADGGADDAAAIPRPNTTANPGTTPRTFAVDVDSRACGRVARAAAIELVAAPVPSPPHKVDLTRPQLTIVVQCVRNVATASVVPRFRELLRLNLARAAQVGLEEIEAREAAAEGAGGGEGEGEEAAAAAAAGVEAAQA